MQFMMPTSLMELKHVTVRGGGSEVLVSHEPPDHAAQGVPSHFPSQAKLKVAQHVWLKSNIIVSGRMRITLNHFAETVVGDDDHDATTDRPASKLIVRIMGRQTDVRLRKHAFLDVGTKAYANRLEMDTGSKMQFMMPTSLMELKHVTVRGGGSEVLVSHEPADHAVQGVPELYPSQAKLKVAQHVWLKSNIIVLSLIHI